MSQFFYVHEVNPQARLISQAVAALKAGGVIVYPTDSGYALGCLIGEKDAMTRMARIRQIENDHNFSLMCRDLSELATYAKVDNQAYRILKVAHLSLIPSFLKRPKKCRVAYKMIRKRP